MKKISVSMFATVSALVLGVVVSVAGCGGDDVPPECHLGAVNGATMCVCADEDGDRTGDFPSNDPACVGLQQPPNSCSISSANGTCTISCSGTTQPVSWYCSSSDNSGSCEVSRSGDTCTVTCPSSSQSWDCSDGSSNPPQEICGDGYDNNGNGQIDEGCNGNPPPVEQCGNGYDDDHDGLVDEGCGGTTNPGTYEVYALAITGTSPINDANWQSQQASQAASCYMNSSCKATMDSGSSGTWSKLATGSYSESYAGYTGAYVIAKSGSCSGPINLQAGGGAPIWGTLKLSNQNALPFSTSGGLSIAFEASDQCAPVVVVVLAQDYFSFSGG